MIARAASELQVIPEKYLTSSHLLEGAPVEAFGAPRRLVAIAPAVRLRQPDLAREVTGPPKSVAYDAVGRRTTVSECVAPRQGSPLAQRCIVSTPRGDYLAAKQVVQGRPAMEVLAEVLPRAIAEIPWPRSMYWTGIDGPRFIRPIRWIVALLGGSAVQFQFAGIAPGKHSAGHRFLGASKIALRGAQDYEQKLRANFVLARPEERRKKIEREIQTLTAKRDLRAHGDPALLDLVTYLNEYPSVILGNFDRGYLDLPQEILITVMRDHQKYFAVENREGRLAPHFLAVINLERDPKGLIGAGHERVLGARFADARFFWETDQKRRLADYLPKLAHVTYESRLGSYGDKVERMRKLAGWLATQLAHALDLIAVATETRLVSDVRQLRQIVGEPTFLIRLPKKTRVSKASAQHPLMPGSDQTFRIALQVDHGKEMRRQSALTVLDGKVLLVIAHHRDENLLGQVEVPPVEIAENHARVFVQVGHQVQQGGVLVGAQVPLRRQSLNLTRDFLAPFLGASEYDIRPHLLLVVLSARERSVRCPKEAVPSGVFAGRNSGELELDSTFAQQGHNPADGPDESRPVNASPIHAPRPRNFSYCPRQHLGKNLHCRSALHDLLCSQVISSRS